MSEPRDPRPEDGAGTTPPSPALPGPAPEPNVPPGPGFLMAVVWVLVLVVAQTAFVIPGAVVTGRLDGPPLIAFATAGTLLTAVLIVGLWYGPVAWEKLAIRAPGGAHLALVLLLSTPLLLVLGEATAWLADAYRLAGAPAWLVEPKMLLDLVDAIRQYDPWPGAAAVAVFGGLLPGVGEELFFRGFLGRGLVARWGVARGVLLTALLTALLFGAVHLHPVHAPITALIGVALHAVYLWTRSLLAPMLLHAVYNGQAILANVLTRGTRHDLAADEHLPPALALAALAAAAGLAYLLYRSRVRWVRADGADWSPGFPSAETPPADAGARLVGGRLSAGRVAIVASAYLLFVVALGWELSR